MTHRFLARIIDAIRSIPVGRWGRALAVPAGLACIVAWFWVETSLGLMATGVGLFIAHALAE